MKLAYLRHFVALANADSLSAAARQLGVSQPLLSRSLRSLERALGVSLVEQRGRRLVLTARGERVAAAAVEVLAAVERVHDAATVDVPVTITVAATPSNQMLLSTRLPGLMALMPEVRLRIETARSPTDMVRLVCDEIADVGFGDLPDRPRGVAVTPCADVEIVLASGESVRLPDPVSVGDLRDVALAVPSRPERQRPLSEFLHDAGVQMVVGLEDDERSVALPAIQAGLVSMLAPRPIFAGVDGVTVRSFSPPLHQPIGAVVATHESRPAASRLVAALAEASWET